MAEILQNPQLEGGPFLWEGGPDGVLLIHGLTATTAEVRPMAQFLHEQGYTVAGALLPGHFSQPAEINRFRWQDWVATIEDAYQHLAGRCRRVVVGGESTGAVLSLYLGGEHPEIAALLTYAPALRLRLRLLDLIRLYAAAPFVPAVPKPVNPPNATDALWQGYRVNPLKGTIQLLRLQRVLRPRLPALRQPLLIVQGKLDKAVDPRAPQEIYDRAGSAVKELHWFDNSSHCVIIDREREEIFKLTHQFIQRALNSDTEV